LFAHLPADAQDLELTVDADMAWLTVRCPADGETRVPVVDPAKSHDGYAGFGIGNHGKSKAAPTLSGERRSLGYSWVKLDHLDDPVGEAYLMTW
jgi:hypothetical protein